MWLWRTMDKLMCSSCELNHIMNDLDPEDYSKRGNPKKFSIGVFYSIDDGMIFFKISKSRDIKKNNKNTARAQSRHYAKNVWPREKYCQCSTVENFYYAKKIYCFQKKKKKYSLFPRIQIKSKKYIHDSYHFFAFIRILTQKKKIR